MEMPPKCSSPVRFLSVFGPGAVIASLTIGSGELIFSSRGGALFGYRLLSLFLVVCLFKWVLTYMAARHMVLTGAHPFQRWMSLPGPRGWLPFVFLLLALPSFPIFVSFHAGTLGTLVASLTKTTQALSGAAYLAWAILILLGAGVLALTGGYARLERVQLVVVALMLGVIAIALIVIGPDVAAMMLGILTPPDLAYPDWAQRYPEVTSRPVWVELSTYIGVVGGSGYDYLAYVSFLREKRWGHAGAMVPQSDLAKIEAAKPWLRMPLVDAGMSFTIVFLFSAAFVVCGREILAVRQEIPSGQNLLTVQAEFVSVVSPWLTPLYYAGAVLAMGGTLYGTIEVAPAVFSEFRRALFGRLGDAKKHHRRAVLWVALGGLTVLFVSLCGRLIGGAAEPPGLVALITPTNLFTGVFACGIITAMSQVIDRRYLPSHLRPCLILQVINVVAAILFLALGIKGYWDHSGLKAGYLFAGTLLAGGLGAVWIRNRAISP